MNPPQGVDMQLIREAIARRAQGGAPAAGGVAPAASQVTAPTGPLPTGGANTPTTPAPQPPPLPAPQAAQVGKTVKVAQAATGPNFDDGTKQIAKTLVAKLIQYL